MLQSHQPAKSGHEYFLSIESTRFPKVGDIRVSSFRKCKRI